MVYHSMGDEDIERIMRYPNTAIASDGGYRVRRRQAASAILWHELLACSPSTSARGTSDARRCDPPDDVTAGADVQPEGSRVDEARYGCRSSAVRSGARAGQGHLSPIRISTPKGFDIVIVNGKVAVENGKLTEARAGKVVRPAVNDSTHRRRQTLRPQNPV